MINPRIFLKKANQLAPIKEPKKGRKARHTLTIDDVGDLCLSIVINQEKGKFYRIKLTDNSNPDSVFSKCRDEVLGMVEEFPVK